jgi:membrane-associated phospholipid phosphatase
MSPWAPGNVPAVIETVTRDDTEQRAQRRFAGVHAERTYRSQTWLVCSAGLLAAVLTLRWLLSLHAFPGDGWAARAGAAPKPWLVYAITRVYQQVGRPLVAVGEVLAMLAWLWHGSGRRAAQGLFFALLASAACGMIKVICGPTPMWLSLQHVGTNFPSGVVTFVTASGGYLTVVAWRRGRRIMPAMMVLVILGAGPARVLGGQHLLSDTLGGYMLGGAWLIAAWAYLAEPARQPSRRATVQTETLRMPATAIGSSHQAAAPALESTSVTISAAVTASAMRQSSPITNSQTNLSNPSSRLT